MEYYHKIFTISVLLFVSIGLYVKIFSLSPGVVVIDDQPEVTIDDPNFLYENNDGFQEVQSKKALKVKQKEREAEIRKQTMEVQPKKKEVVSKVRVCQSVSRQKSMSNLVLDFIPKFIIFSTVLVGWAGNNLERALSQDYSILKLVNVIISYLLWCW